MSDNQKLVVDQGKPENLGQDKSESMFPKLWAEIIKSLFEFTGTFLFALAIYFTNGDVGKFVWGFWVILTFFGGYSGGHVNPAISLGFYFYDADWGFGLIKLLLFWTAQFLGAGCAAGFAQATIGKSVFVGIPANSTLFEIVFSELIFTGTFLFIILFACSKITGKDIQPVPLKTGLIVGWFYCAVQMGAGLSGAAYNPAILFTFNVQQYIRGNATAMNNVFWMIASELIGATVFSFIFKYGFETAYDKPKEKEIKE